MTVDRSGVEQFLATIADVAAAVVSQVSGSSWVGETSITPPTERTLSLKVALSGDTNAAFRLSLEADSARALAAAFVGEAWPTDGSNIDAATREACGELLRQVCGALATSADSLGRVKLSYEDDAELAADFSSSVVLKSEKAAASILVELDARLCEALSHAVSDASAGADLPVHETEPTATTSASAVATDTFPHASPQSSEVAASPLSNNLDLLLEVELGAMLRFGRREMLLKEILELSAGSVVELDHLVDEPVELLVDRRLIARGEVVIVDGNYGLRVSEIVADN